MNLKQMSNGLLIVGVLILAVFAVLQFSGLASDPLLPASAAFFIGCTAVLDRVGAREWN